MAQPDRPGPHSARRCWPDLHLGAGESRFIVVVRSGRHVPSGGQVGQFVEQRTENPRVGGSIPSLATTYRSHEVPPRTATSLKSDKFPQILPRRASLLTRDRPMSENTISAALRRLGYDGYVQTGHGFRSMASTLLNEQGFPPDVIELQLGSCGEDQGARCVQQSAAVRRAKEHDAAVGGLSRCVARKYNPRREGFT